MATGDIEINLEKIQVLNKAADTLPIPVSKFQNVSEGLLPLVTIKSVFYYIPTINTADFTSLLYRQISLLK